MCPCRLLSTLWTTVRPARSAAIDARPTCVPTCSLLMEVAATSVVSATVSMKVRTVQCNKSDVRLSSQKKTHRTNFWNQKVKKWNYEYTVHGSTFSFMSLAYPSASLLFPTSWPRGPEGGLLREAWAVHGVLWVFGHFGVLQGTGQLLNVCRMD